VSGLRDEDGNELRRDRDGDVIRVVEPDPDCTPAYEPDDRCAQHTHFDYLALTCVDCWSEIKAGERPRWHLGRIYPLAEMGASEVIAGG
jgi:hypothetical protein